MATKKCVNSDSLNLRSEPTVAAGNIIASLPKAHEVTFTGAPANGWVAVSTKLGNSTKQGFVAMRHLRDPVSDSKEKLIRNAVAEWLRFDKGAGKEHRVPYFKFVGEMWDAIGINLNGKNTDQPWSAAFISWIVRKGGTDYKGFAFSAAHAKYINDSIRKRKDNKDSPFWGFRVNEHKVGLGDLVCQWRVHTQTFDGAAASDAFKSHCDVVVELNSGRAKAIGGNNSDSVSMKTYSRDANGFLLAQNKVFAVLRNNA